MTYVKHILFFAIVAVFANISRAADFEVEAGSFAVGSGLSAEWDSEFGKLSSDSADPDASLAGRLMLGNPEGLEFGFGVRASNAQWNASMGSTASAAYATANEAAKTAQGELDLLDPANPDNKDAIDDATKRLSDATGRMESISSQHTYSKETVGGSATVMRNFKLSNGSTIGFGSELYADADNVVPAARVTYGSKQGDTRWNAVGYVGEDWAGAGLSIKF